MEKVFYDLHIHSCLSPCGDDLMTPPNIANMAWLKGLQLIAVTDHNSCRNARAVAEAAKELPLTVIPGIELTTAEEIHVVCLFPGFDEGLCVSPAASGAKPGGDFRQAGDPGPRGKFTGNNRSAADQRHLPVGGRCSRFCGTLWRLCFSCPY